MSENCKMCISVDSNAVKILALKFLAVMEMMDRTLQRSIFWGTLSRETEQNVQGRLCGMPIPISVPIWGRADITAP